MRGGGAWGTAAHRPGEGLAGRQPPKIKRGVLGAAAPQGSPTPAAPRNPRLWGGREPPKIKRAQGSLTPASVLAPSFPATSRCEPEVVDVGPRDGLDRPQIHPRRWGTLCPTYSDRFWGQTEATFNENKAMLSHHMAYTFTKDGDEIALDLTCGADSRCTAAAHM